MFQPSKDDPRIIGALDAQTRLGAAMRARDMNTVEALMAPSLIVNAPINRIVDRGNVLARLLANEIAYEDAKRTIEFAGVRGNSVVIMGEEVVTPTANAPLAGRVARRRFTDVWENIDGLWKLAIRQATYFQVE